MRPAVIVLGFVMGSAAAITFALGGTVVVFVVLKGEYPRVAAELGELLRSVGLFVALTTVAAAAFYGQLRERPWRRSAVAALLLMLSLMAANYGFRYADGIP